MWCLRLFLASHVTKVMEIFQNVGRPTEIFSEMLESKSCVWHTAIRTVGTKVRRLCEAGQRESSAYIVAHIVRMSKMA